MVRGMAFIQENYTRECYTYIPTSIDSGEIHCIKKTVEMKSSPYPFLLVNIGSGVSILKVLFSYSISRGRLSLSMCVSVWVVLVSVVLLFWV